MRKLQWLHTSAMLFDGKCHRIDHRSERSQELEHRTILNMEDVRGCAIENLQLSYRRFQKVCASVV